MALKKAPAASSANAAPKAKVPVGKPASKPAAKVSATKPKAATKKASAPAVTVTIKHLAAELMEAHEVSKKQSETLVVDVFERLVSHLKAGNKLRINGLGVMEIKDRPARMGRNPATGEVIKIAASRKIAFRPAKDLKESI